VVAGEVVIGYLYNFCYNGSVLGYQSGFDYAAAGTHERPGLTCHHMAIERAAASGMWRYDFLAGEDRYKTSLASGSVALHWLDLVARWSPRGVVARVRAIGHS
jgi:CelD/BcsL family acetyltransferase involved in cellulose biosynthesis